MKKIHNLYYLVELLILTGGFYVIFRLSYSFKLQAIALIGVLIFYTIAGIFHHKVQHNLHIKIVIEYILISLLMLAIFLFINIGKI